MLKAQRFDAIRDVLKKHPYIALHQLIKLLPISRETLRRDLIEMESMQIIKRVHGGIMRLDAEPDLAVREKMQVREKQNIAKAALGYLHSGDVIFVDAGSTTAIFLEQLSQLSDMTIITNSLSAAMNLKRIFSAQNINNIVHLLGGELLLDTSATYGVNTLLEIGHFHADLAIFSPVGLHHHFGATCFYSQEGAVVRAMVKNARQVMVLSDDSKWSTVSHFQMCALDEIDILITNAGVEAQPDFQLIKETIQEVIIA